MSIAPAAAAAAAAEQQAALAEIVPDDVEVMATSAPTGSPDAAATTAATAAAATTTAVATATATATATDTNDIVHTTTTMSKWPESLPHPKSHFVLSVVCGNTRYHWALHDPASPTFHAKIYWKTAAPKPVAHRHGGGRNATTTTTPRREEAAAAPSAQAFFLKYFPEKAYRMILGNEKDPPNNTPPLDHQSRTVVQKLWPFFFVQDIPILTIYVISTNDTGFAELQHLVSRLPTRLICMQAQDFFNPNTCMPPGYTGMGIDRLAALCGAEQLHGGPALVIDGGTATTFTATAIREEDDDEARGAAAAATGAAAATNKPSVSVWNTVKVRGGGIGPGLSCKFSALHSRTSALPHIRYNQVREYIQQCKQQQTIDPVQSSMMISVLDSKQTREAMMNYVLRETACHLQSVIATWAKEAMASPTFQKRQREKIAALAAEERDKKKKKDNDDDDDDDDEGRPVGDAGHKVNHNLTVVVTGGDSDIFLDLLNDGDGTDGGAVLHPDTVLPELPCKVKFVQDKHIIHQAMSHVLCMQYIRNKNVPKQDINDVLVGQRVVQKRQKKRLMRGTVLACCQPETNDDDDNTHKEDVYQIVYDNGNRGEMNGEELYDALLLYNNEGEGLGHNDNAPGEKAHVVLEDDLEEMRDAKRKAAKEACKALEQCVPVLVARMAKLEAERMAKLEAERMAKLEAERMAAPAEANGNGKRVYAADGQASEPPKRSRCSQEQDDDAPPVLPPTSERPNSYVGRRVAKFFDGECYFGEIDHFDLEAKLWRVIYDDGDEEDFDADDMIDHFQLYEFNKDGDTR